MSLDAVWPEEGNQLQTCARCVWHLPDSACDCEKRHAKETTLQTVALLSSLRSFATAFLFTFALATTKAAFASSTTTPTKAGSVKFKFKKFCQMLRLFRRFVHTKFDQIQAKMKR